MAMPRPSAQLRDTASRAGRRAPEEARVAEDDRLLVEFGDEPPRPRGPRWPCAALMGTETGPLCWALRDPRHRPPPRPCLGPILCEWAPSRQAIRPRTLEGERGFPEGQADWPLLL